MDKPFCRNFNLLKRDEKRWGIGLSWHRFHEGQRLPPGWTGTASVEVVALPERFQRAIAEIIESLETLVNQREASIRQRLGFSGTAIYAVQVAAYNAADWEAGKAVELLTGGIGIQYHRLKARVAGSPPWWDGDLLFDKLPGGNAVSVNRGDMEQYKSPERAEELVKRIQTILSLGSEIAAWLDEKEGQ